jgi:hypothetical protein
MRLDRGTPIGCRAVEQTGRTEGIGTDGVLLPEAEVL